MPERKPIVKLKPLKGEEWAMNNLGELAREIQKTQKKLNELIDLVQEVTKCQTAFQLIPKGQEEPEKLVVVDQKICDALGAECHPTYWHRGWYDLIGFGIACGKTFEQLREIYPDMVDIIDFLDTNYTTDAWAEIGRRS